MPWTEGLHRRLARARTRARGRSTAVSAAAWLGACAVGVEGEEAASSDAFVATPSNDAGVTEAAAPAELPPWLADPRFDAGTRGVSVDLDAGGPDLPVTSRDASRPLDASRPTTPPRGNDAGSARPSTGSTGSTRCQASTCTNECSLAGPLRCCSDRGTCGCTWAPGAYCI
jgi:hypothetical protein